MFVYFFGAASLVLKFFAFKWISRTWLLASSKEFFGNLSPRSSSSFPVISSLPSAFHGLGFSFSVVRFTLSLESNNVF